MSCSFFQLPVESRDLFQAEKEIAVCKADEIHKMTTLKGKESCHFESK